MPRSRAAESHPRAVPAMGQELKLVGLDFGSTTCSAVVAGARLHEDRLTGRRELVEVTPRYRSELAFTPFGERPAAKDEPDEANGLIDLEAAARLLDGWLAAGGVRGPELFGGGALITGLCARKANAARLAELVRARLGEAVIATADDPCLESLVAFLGSCGELSRGEPQTPLLNLDIGGGTTNLALGRAGEVLRTGCLRVGARHLRFVPGTYRLNGCSALGARLLAHLGIARQRGDQLTQAEVEAVVDYQVTLLEAACSGQRAPLKTALGREFEQVELRLPAELHQCTLVFSGGVGALIHARLSRPAEPPTTCFGDLGPHLAQRIIESQLLRRPVRTDDHAGRATVLGLLTGCTQIAGSSVFLARPDCLPLRDLPIVGRISLYDSAAELTDALLLLRHSPRGGALQVTLPEPTPAALRTLGARLHEGLQALAFPPEQPVVLLLAQNLAKVLGGYITGWRPAAFNLIVLDELAVGAARFVHLGRAHEQLIPVSLYGLQR